MASSLQFKIAAQLDSQGFKDAAAAVRDMGKAAGEAGGQTDSLAGSVSGLKNIYGALVGAGIVAFYKSCVDAAAKQEQAETDLQRKLEAGGVNWSKVKGQIDAFTMSLEQNTVYSRTEATDALNKLYGRLGDLGTAETSLEEAMALSKRTGKDLTETTEMVASAHQGFARGLLQVGRNLGLTAAEAKNQDAVLAALHKNVSLLTTGQDTLNESMKKAKNQFDEAKIAIGEGLAPAVVYLADIFDKAMRSIADIVSFTMNTIYQDALKVELAYYKFLAVFGSKDAKAHIIELEGALKELDEDAEKTAVKIADVWSGKKAGGIEATAKPGPTKKETAEAADYTDALKKVNSELDEYVKKGEKASGKEKSELEEAQATHDKLISELKAYHKNHMIEDGEFDDDVEKADKALAQQQIAIRAQANKKILEEYSSGVQGMAQMTGKALAGDKEAFKSWAKDTVDQVAKKTESATMMNAIQGASEQVAIGDWPGAAASLAWGAAQVAGIEALASVVGGASGGGASSSGGSTGGAAAPATAAAPAAAGSAASQAGALTVNIQGDYIGDPAFINRLAEKLSAAVENQNVRLVAQQTVNG